MRELSLFVSVALCLPTLARAQTREPIIPAGSLLECTLEEPNFSSASAEAGDPLICHTRGVQEFACGFAACSRAACGSAGSTMETAGGVAFKTHWISTTWSGTERCSLTPSAASH